MAGGCLQCMRSRRYPMAMIENRRKKSLIALSMVTPFIVVFVL